MIEIRHNKSRELLLQVDGDSLAHQNLSRANLSGADLQGMSLVFANLSGADLSGANLTHTFFNGANLSGANLSGANLTQTRFLLTNLQGVSLRHTDLRSTVPMGADLLRANRLGWAGLEPANFTGACYDTSTRWPTGFNPIKHGAVWVK